MKKRIIILVFVLILASILRLYKIGEVPYDQAADYIDTIGHYTEVKWLYDNIFVKHNFNFHNLDTSGQKSKYKGLSLDDIIA